MKEFMMIFIGGNYDTGELSPEDIQARMQKWNEWMADLSEQKLFVHGNALKTTAIQVAGDKDRVATDGPFVETNELITGFITVKAKDLEHAKELTGGYPDFDLGGIVEIREVQIF